MIFKAIDKIRLRVKACQICVISYAFIRCEKILLCLTDSDSDDIIVG